ncbi:MAG: cytochrome C oxidase subunit IV family protein [Saccharospirillum sp.]|nr:cytochrome C oxidase subunit IV family protein [Saccharospirillum sp.]
MTEHSQDQSQEHDQEHDHPSVALYLKVWILLFIISALSYMVDIIDFQGMLRWSLIIIFMILKAGLIMAVFMHFSWESKTLKVALLVPTFAIPVFMLFMIIEANYTFVNRMLHMGG